MEAISQISSLVKEYIMPETVWLVPCLYALGSIIKRSIRIDDTLIPTVLCVVGIFLSALVSVASCEPTNWIQWVILVAVSIGQGYVLAAAAVCLNQLIKQHSIAGRLKKGFDGQNSIERKEGMVGDCRENSPCVPSPKDWSCTPISKVKEGELNQKNFSPKPSIRSTRLSVARSQRLMPAVSKARKTTRFSATSTPATTSVLPATCSQP